MPASASTVGHTISSVGSSGGYKIQLSSEACAIMFGCLLMCVCAAHIYGLFKVM